MPSSTRRSAPPRPPAPVRRSPRAAPRPVPAWRTTTVLQRPLVAAYAAVFGLLVAAEDAYLAWLLLGPEKQVDSFLAVPLVLCAVSLAGAALTYAGRARGWLVLLLGALPTLLGILGLTVLFAALGGGRPVAEALLLLVGPIGCLALCLRRQVRGWTRPRRARSPRG